MKLKFLTTFAAALIVLRAAALTPVQYVGDNFYSPTSSQQVMTNPFTIQPVFGSQVTVYGTTNLILGPVQTITPGTNGQVLFYLYPNSYVVTFPFINYSGIANIPDQTNVLNLATALNGVGTFTYTNNNNFLVYAAPGDTIGGTLAEKLTFSGGFVLITNYVGPDYILNLSLPTGLLFAPATNTVVTNFAAGLLLISNYFANAFNQLDGSANSIYPGTNNVVLGGTSNTLGSAWSTNETLIGGENNGLDGTIPDSTMIGGMLNHMTAYGRGSSILGGSNDVIDAYWCTVLGGSKNSINGGWNNTILGGYNNQIYYGATNSVGGGSGAAVGTPGSFVWSDSQGLTNQFGTTGANQFLVRVAGGVGINTNNPGTNSLAVFGNADATSISIGGTNLFTLFSTTGMSNALSILWAYNLNLASNLLYVTSGSNATFATAVSNQTYTLGQATTNNQNTVSNKLQTQILNVSNQVSTAQSKALTATLAATFASAGVGFNTPLMPDGNYSVVLTPQDSATAGALASGLSWWISTKTTSGFTLNVPYATNFNLNFECLVHENTQ